jgi:hypothetical protein
MRATPEALACIAVGPDLRPKVHGGHSKMLGSRGGRIRSPPVRYSAPAERRSNPWGCDDSRNKLRPLVPVSRVAELLP